MKPLPPRDWDQSLDHVIDDMGGRPLNIHSMMANHPELLKAWWNLRNYSVTGGDLEQRECELVILRVSYHMQTWYEWASHIVRGLASGLSNDEIKRVLIGPGDPNWDEGDAVLLRSVDELILERQVSKTTRESFARFFSPNQLMDVMAIQGMYITIACMINTWGLELDEHIREQLPADLSESPF